MSPGVPKFTVRLVELESLPLRFLRIGSANGRTGGKRGKPSVNTSGWCSDDDGIAAKAVLGGLCTSGKAVADRVRIIDGDERVVAEADAFRLVDELVSNEYVV